MEIELKSLDLVHFKCFPKLHLDFHEGVAAFRQGQRRPQPPGHQADWCTGRRDARGDRHSGGGR